MDHCSKNRVPELPALDSGIQILDESGTTERSDVVPVIHALALDHLLLNGGNIHWVDVRGHATVNPLLRLTPSPRLLERIHVARAFTGYQHAQLMSDLADQIDEETSLIICPAVDYYYREECRDPDGEDLMLRSIATLARLAREYNIPVLVTRYQDDAFSQPLVEAARGQLAFEQTKYGPRFTGEEFETLVYPVGHGMLQTTFAFWREILRARTPLYEQASTPMSRSSV